MQVLLLSLLYVFMFGWVIYKAPFFKLVEIPSVWLLIGFGLKLLAGICLWALYTYYYTNRSEADIFKYFDDGFILFRSLKTHPSDYFNMMIGWDASPYFQTNYYSHMQVWSPRYSNTSEFETHAMIRLNALLDVISLANYHINSIIVNFLSFAGLVALFKVYKVHSNNLWAQRFCFLSLIITPSLLFWGSGVWRETVIIFLLGFLIYFLSKKKWGYSLVFALLLLSLKGILVALVGYFFILDQLFKKFRINKPWYNLLFTLPLLFFLLMVLAQLSPFNFFQNMSEKQHLFITQSEGGVFVSRGKRMLRIDDAQAPKIIAVGEDSCKIVGVPYYFLSPHFHDTIYQFPMDADQGIYRINERLKPAKSFIEIPPLGHSPLSFIKALPSAYLRSLFRPFPFERNDKLMTLSGLENAVLMVLFILVFVYGNTTLLKQSGLLYILLVGSCYLTSIGWLTPNYGTLMRYKIIGLSLLLPPLVLVFPWRKKSKK